MLRTARWPVLVASLGHLIAYCFAVPEHIVDAEWPFHARFHIVQSLLWIVGFDLVCAFVAFGPFARGAVWARWVLLAGLLFAHLGYFVALVAVPDGHPTRGMGAHIPLAGILVLFAIGLALGWRASARDAPAE